MTNFWPNLPATRVEAHYQDRMIRVFAERPHALDALLREAARKWPEREALVAQADDGSEIRLRFAELDRRVDRVAEALLGAGMRKSDRIALLLGNRVEFVTVFLGVLRAGGVALLLNTRQQTPELEFALNDSTARLIIFEADLEDRLPAADAVPYLEGRLAVGGDASSFARFVAQAEGAQVTVPVNEEHGAILMYTSGTTGKPKGAVLTHLSTITSVMQLQYCWNLTEEDRTVMAVPMSHVTGAVALLLTMIRVGGATILQKNFKAAEFLELASRERMTYTILVPAMYNLCLLQADFDRYDLKSWRIGGYGGAPMAVGTFEQIAQKIPSLHLMAAYGATETSSPATLCPQGMGPDHADAAGVPLPCADIRIMDENGCEVPLGETGEVWIGGGMTVPGYANNADANSANFTAGFWHSGDIGCMTADGWLKILDRKKDMINRAGFKVYSVEVESVLAKHPLVGEVAVVAEPDPVLGEKVHAFVLAKEPGLTLEDVRAFCAERLSNYKVPDLVTFVDAPLPRSANGKILKRELRK